MNRSSFFFSRLATVAILGALALALAFPAGADARRGRGSDDGRSPSATLSPDADCEDDEDFRSGTPSFSPPPPLFSPTGAADLELRLRGLAGQPALPQQKEQLAAALLRLPGGGAGIRPESVGILASDLAGALVLANPAALDAGALARSLAGVWSSGPLPTSAVQGMIGEAARVLEAAAVPGPAVQGVIVDLQALADQTRAGF